MDDKVLNHTLTGTPAFFTVMQGVVALNAPLIP